LPIHSISNKRENLMRTILIAMLMIAGVSLATTHEASAAAASGAPIANALTQFDNTQAEPVACRRICDWRGCRTRCWGGPAYILAPPVVVGPACRSVRVCDWRGCFWRRRCW
jgi:hypothetical protein